MRIFTSLKSNFYLWPFLGLTIFSFCFFLAISGAAAQEAECAPAEYAIVARDSSGNFIPDIAVEVYEQTVDADNNPKPGVKIASGKTSAITGKFTGTIKLPANKTYALKLNSLGKDATAFWFYDDLVLNCGDNEEISESLSAIEFIIRDAAGNLRTNEAFSLYAQKYDADNQPLKEKASLLAALTTGESGKKTVYVPSGADCIGGNGSDYYIFEKAGASGGIFTQYDIHVISGSTARVEYILSGLKLEMRDINETRFPANSKIEIFKQITDADDNSVLGEKIKDIYTDDLGNAQLEYPAGIYAARLLGESGIYTYFWNLEIADQKQAVYALTTNESWQPSGGACEASSNFILYTRDLDYNFIPNLNFNLFEQGINADGKPYAAGKLAGGKISAAGEGKIVINPDPRKKYALQIYENNETVGDFWFFDQMQFTCGQNIEITKQLPALTIILRDSNSALLKNQLFSLYTQKYDADGKPIKEKKDLISNKYTSGETGKIMTYLAPSHQYLGEKRGTYVLELIRPDKALFTEYGINISAEQDYNLDYLLSGLVITYKNAEGKINTEKNIDIYKQSKNANGQYLLGDKIKTLKTDIYGAAGMEYPAGYYAAAVKDSLAQNNIFWSQPINNRAKNNITLAENKTKISVKDKSEKNLNKIIAVNIYLLKEADGQYVVDKKLKALNTSNSGLLEISLAPGAYLFSVIDQKIEYGQALYAQNKKIQTLAISLISGQIITSGQKFTLSRPSGTSLAERLKGRLLLQVESLGEAWYLDTVSLRRYYVKDGPSAYEALRKFGLGITNADLNKIPIGLDARFEEWDYDGDLVPDKMEEALGTDMYNYDSDNDGYNDGLELKNGYNPLGSGKLSWDENLAKRLSGKILLQTESKGEAWYVNPADNRRYYMKDGESAYEIMRFLSLGITNANLEKIEIGEL